MLQNNEGRFGWSLGHFSKKHLGSLGGFSLGIKLPCYGDYLEDHPSGCKWLITMGDRFCPLNGVVGPLTNGRTSWLINGGDPNYLLTGMILQVQYKRSFLRILVHQPFQWNKMGPSI